MGALPQAIEIIFEMQMKRIDEIIRRRKIRFPTCKTLFFFLFKSLLLSNLITFLISYSF
jgi:hypothetical protein